MAKAKDGLGSESGRPVLRIDIPPELDQLLIRWAIWNRGHYMPDLAVKCSSLESDYLPPAGAVYEGTEEAIKSSLGTYRDSDDPRTVSDPEALHTEIIVLRLPKLNREALRLHYVEYKRLPVRQRCRMLGVGFEGYTELVKRSALMVRNCQ